MVKFKQTTDKPVSPQCNLDKWAKIDLRSPIILHSEARNQDIGESKLLSDNSRTEMDATKTIGIVHRKYP